MRSADFRRLGLLVAATLVLGALIGAGAGLLTLLLYGVEHVMLGYVESGAAPGPFHVPAVRRAVSVTVGLSVAALVWWLLRTKTTKVPSVKKAVAGERMPWWQTIVHVVLQIFIVGSGASIGREVAPRELGAMLAQRFCDLFHIGGEGSGEAGLADRRMIVAVAAGAGLGGVYDAPLAGMFFAVEILLADVTIEKVGFALGMSATAAYVASLVKGRHTFYAVAGMTADYTPSLMLFALLCGAACGAAGALFRKGSSWATAHQPKGAALLWQMPLAGLFTGLVAVFAPQVMGNGRAAAQLGFDGLDMGAVVAAYSAQTVHAAQVWPLIGLLAATFLAKAVTTLATIRSGASGGVLQPGIALGATLGATLGILWSFTFPGDPVGVCALIGAAALLSASQQAPLMAMCLVMELAEAPIALFVPVGLAVAASALTSKRVLDAWKR
ncbi:chloride channel protein [Bifidobacterium parmae]|uniref:Chloride channel protein n=1 Tax=Bifidobacterium parmae TaxID=361854 RepID=A0A2N5IW70_9BIFI|nr:chloride channel protein [Bifidobacterium parmae]PLS26205.1 chloride channel protein [Bifidobacterium parmae]